MISGLLFEGEISYLAMNGCLVLISHSYASGQMRKFPLSLDLSSLDYEIKAKTFFEYAKYDAQLVRFFLR